MAPSVNDLPDWAFRWTSKGRGLRQQLDDLAEHHRKEIDPRDNQETCPPEHEILTWHGAYVVEAYGPSHVDSLIAAVDRLGWNRADQPGEVPLGEWLAKSREDSSSGAHFPLNSIGPTRTVGSRAHVAELPNGIDHGRGLFIQVSPGLTLLIGLFGFDEATSARVDGVLRTDFRSTPEGSLRNWTLESVSNLKIDAVASERRKLLDLAGHFIQANLPGAFSTDLGRPLPACEIITTEKLKPFKGRTKPGRCDYAWVLGFDHSLHAWKSGQLTGFRFTLPGAMRAPMAVLVGRNKAVCRGLHPSDGTERDRILNHLWLGLDGTVGTLACYELLNGYHRLLAGVRDTRTSGDSSTRRSVMQLSRARQALLVDASDARTLAEELIGLADRPERYGLRRFMTDFQASDPRIWEEPTSLHTTLTRSITEEAEALLRIEERVRDNLIIDSNLSAAAGNLRVQVTVIRLTIVLLVLTIVQIWLAATGGA